MFDLHSNGVTHSKNNDDRREVSNRSRGIAVLLACWPTSLRISRKLHIHCPCIQTVTNDEKYCGGFIIIRTVVSMKLIPAP